MSQFRIFGILVIITLGFVFSCKYPDIPKHLEIRDYLKLDYAPYLRKSETIHPNAVISLQNKFRGVFYIVVPQNWSSDSGYVQYLFDSLGNDLKNVKKTANGLKDPMVLRDTAYKNVNGYQVQDILVTGTLSDRKMIFDMQLIQKDTFLYQTSGWCFMDKRDMWMKDIDAMNNSLTILDGKKN